MFTKIMYFTVVVSDQDKSLEFYTLLGFEKRVDYNGPDGRFLTVSFKDQDVAVMLWKGNPPSENTNAETSIKENPGTLFIETKDLHRAFEFLRNKGVEFIEAQPEEYP